MSVAYKKNGTEIPITSAIMGGGANIPDYANTIGIADNSVLNYTPTKNGIITVIINTANALSNEFVYENGVAMSNYYNGNIMLVTAGKTYTTTNSIRIAKFTPFK